MFLLAAAISMGVPKMQDVKMTDQVARQENAAHEIVIYFSSIVILFNMFCTAYN